MVHPADETGRDAVMLESHCQPRVAKALLLCGVLCVIVKGAAGAPIEVGFSGTITLVDASVATSLASVGVSVGVPLSGRFTFESLTLGTGNQGGAELYFDAVFTSSVELTRFRGHPQTWGERSHDAEEPTTVSAGVPAADGRPGARGADA